MRKFGYAAVEDVQWTKRQRQVLDLLAGGHTNPEIAEALGLTLWGAKWHVSEVMSRLGAVTREEAALYWRRFNSPGDRLGRAFRALTAFSLSPKLVGGALGVAALAGGGIVVAGLASDRAFLAQPDATPTTISQVFDYPPVFATPSGPIELISVRARGDFRRELYAFQSAHGICLAYGNTLYRPDGTREYLPSESSQQCPEAVDVPGSNWDRGPVLFGLGIAPQAWFASGMAATNVARIVVTTVDGDTWDIPLIPAPASLQTDWTFFQAFLNDQDSKWSTSRVDAFDRDGKVLFEQSYVPVRPSAKN